MANVRILHLPAASTIAAGAGALPIQQGGVTQKATPNQIVQEVLKSPGAIGATTPGTGAFSTLSSTGMAILNGTTIPTSKTLVSTDATQTLTNKTVNLTSNTLTGTIAQFNTACSDADFLSTSGSATLTNKGIDLATNTVTGTIAQFNTACSDADFATLSGSESLTNKTISAIGQIKSSSTTAGVGYATGAGGVVTQATNRTTAVTINNVCGQITTVSATTGDNTFTSFTVNNSVVTAADTIILSLAQPGFNNKYIISAVDVTAGAFKIQTYTPIGVLAAESLTINFSVIKSVNA